MAGQAPIVVGLVIAARRPCTAVALRCGRTLEVVGWCEADERVPGERDYLVGWVASLRPAVVGIDAPQRPRREGARSRACDAELQRRRIAVYAVPTRRLAEAGGARFAWMRAGWAYFRELRRRGFESPAPGTLPAALGQGPAVLEVYPHAGFVTLMGGTPPPKGTRQGLRARVCALRALGVRWDEYYDRDSLDALMGAYTAWRFHQGLATPLGSEREGLVWVPVPANELRESYGPLSA